MAQMARWLAYIEQFDFEIQHRAGSKHGNADGLSRTPTHDDAVRTIKQQNGDSFVEDVVNDRQALTKAQLDDPDIGPVLRAIMRSPEVPDIGQLTPEAPAVKRFVAEWFRLKLVDQVLYRLKPAAGGRPDYLQLVVPASMRQDFMRRAHTGMTGGHYGSQRTQDQVQRRGYWYGWRKDVKRFCRQCENCSERYF